MSVPEEYVERVAQRLKNWDEKDEYYQFIRQVVREEFESIHHTNELLRNALRMKEGELNIQEGYCEGHKEQRDEHRDEAARLERAIRHHRDQRGDDRCWLDDVLLYESLPGGAKLADQRLPPPEEMLANCKRFIASRHARGEPYVSPNMEIERLQDELDKQQQANVAPLKVVRELTGVGTDFGMVNASGTLVERFRELLSSARALARDISKNYDCDTDSGSDHSAHCRCCKAEALYKKLGGL